MYFVYNINNIYQQYIELKYLSTNLYSIFFSIIYLWVDFNEIKKTFRNILRPLLRQ